MVVLKELKKKIDKKLEVGALPAQILQSKFKVGFPSFAYGDPTFMPFYYYLGTFMRGSKNLIEFGFDLGMSSGCFIDGAKTVENFLAFRKNTSKYHTKRLGFSNIHNILRKKFDFWQGDEYDPDFIKMVLLRKWDCVIICDNNQKETTYRAYLDCVWNQLIHEGLIIIDFLNESSAKSAYNSFCKIQGKDPFTINTTRGIGILQK